MVNYVSDCTLQFTIRMVWIWLILYDPCLTFVIHLESLRFMSYQFYLYIYLKSFSTNLFWLILSYCWLRYVPIRKVLCIVCIMVYMYIKSYVTFNLYSKVKLKSLLYIANTYIRTSFVCKIPTSGYHSPTANKPIHNSNIYIYNIIPHKFSRPHPLQIKLSLKTL